MKYGFLTIAVNFGIGSDFSEGPWSAFFETSSPGLGWLYKVCLSRMSDYLV